MNTKDAIRFVLESNRGIVEQYVGDLTDAELLVRPAPGANHIAWQLGHLIVAEGFFFMSKVPGGKGVELPAGFVEQHSNEMASSDSPAGFKTKAEYLELFKRVRANTLAELDRISDATLDEATDVPQYAPTVGAIFLSIGSHDMMHAGQFTVVRRKLGKPVLF